MGNVLKRRSSSERLQKEYADATSVKAFLVLKKKYDLDVFWDVVLDEYFQELDTNIGSKALAYVSQSVGREVSEFRYGDYLRKRFYLRFWECDGKTAAAIWTSVHVRSMNDLNCWLYRTTNRELELFLQECEHIEHPVALEQAMRLVSTRLWSRIQGNMSPIWYYVCKYTHCFSVFLYDYSIGVPSFTSNCVLAWIKRDCLRAKEQLKVRDPILYWYLDTIFDKISSRNISNNVSL